MGSRTSAAFTAPVTSMFCGGVMVKVRSVYGRLGLAASHMESAMDLGQSNGVCSVNLVLAYSHVFITLLGNPSPNLVVLLNVTKLRGVQHLVSIARESIFFLLSQCHSDQKSRDHKEE